MDGMEDISRDEMRKLALRIGSVHFRRTYGVGSVTIQYAVFKKTYSETIEVTEADYYSTSLHRELKSVPNVSLIEFSHEIPFGFDRCKGYEVECKDRERLLEQFEDLSQQCIDAGFGDEDNLDPVEPVRLALKSLVNKS